MPILIKGSGKVPKLQAKTVTPNTINVKVTPDRGYDGLSQVTVSAIKLQTKTVTPSASSTAVTPDISYTGLSRVTVSGDSNLTAANIKSGVSIFGVSGTYSAEPKVYVAHSITPKSLSKSSSDEWTSCTQITMNNNAITKLLDANNSATMLPSDLYNKYPNAVIAILSSASIQGLSANFRYVSQFACYYPGGGTNYDGNAYGSMYTSLSFTDSSRTFLVALSGSGTVIGQLCLPHNYNMATDCSYDVYLIY